MWEHHIWWFFFFPFSLLSFFVYAVLLKFKCNNTCYCGFLCSIKCSYFSSFEMCCDTVSFAKFLRIIGKVKPLVDSFNCSSFSINISECSLLLYSTLFLARQQGDYFLLFWTACLCHKFRHIYLNVSNVLSVFITMQM